MLFAAATATASYCVTNGAHVKRAHAAINTRDEVSDPATAYEGLPKEREARQSSLPRAKGNKSERAP